MALFRVEAADAGRPIPIPTLLPPLMLRLVPGRCEYEYEWECVGPGGLRGMVVVVDGDDGVGVRGDERARLVPGRGGCGNVW